MALKLRPWDRHSCRAVSNTVVGTERTAVSAMHRQSSEDAAGASRQLLQTATQLIREGSNANHSKCCRIPIGSPRVFLRHTRMDTGLPIPLPAPH